MASLQAYALLNANVTRVSKLNFVRLRTSYIYSNLADMVAKGDISNAR